jgi:hypothetical protein
MGSLLAQTQLALELEVEPLFLEVNMNGQRLPVADNEPPDFQASRRPLGLSPQCSRATAARVFVATVHFKAVPRFRHGDGSQTLGYRDRAR